MLKSTTQGKAQVALTSGHTTNQDRNEKSNHETTWGSRCTLAMPMSYIQHAHAECHPWVPLGDELLKYRSTKVHAPRNAPMFDFDVAWAGQNCDSALVRPNLT
eukprot:4925611-Amphidinium_carterae.1